MKQKQQEIDRDVQLEVPDSPDDYGRPAGERTGTTPQTVPIDQMQVERRAFRRPNRRSDWLDGSLDLESPRGRRLLATALNSPNDGLKSLPLARPGESHVIEVTDWIAVWKTDIQAPDGSVRSGWAVTLFCGDAPVLSWGSAIAERQWSNLMGCLPTCGPWDPPLRVKIVAVASNFKGSIWYSFLPAD